MISLAGKALITAVSGLRKQGVSLIRMLLLCLWGIKMTLKTGFLIMKSEKFKFYKGKSRRKRDRPLLININYFSMKPLQKTA